MSDVVKMTILFVGSLSFIRLYNCCILELGEEVAMKSKDNVDEDTLLHLVQIVSAETEAQLKHNSESYLAYLDLIGAVWKRITSGTFDGADRMLIIIYGLLSVLITVLQMIF